MTFSYDIYKNKPQNLQTVKSPNYSSPLRGGADTAETIVVVAIGVRVGRVVAVRHLQVVAVVVPISAPEPGSCVSHPLHLQQ